MHRNSCQPLVLDPDCVPEAVAADPCGKVTGRVAGPRGADRGPWSGHGVGCHGCAALAMLLLVLWLGRADGQVLLQQGAVSDATAALGAGPDEIGRWVVELNDDRFGVRRNATEQLILAGEPAIRPVLEAMAGSNLEVLTRGVYILRELALDKDVSTQEAAVSALGQLAESSTRSIARQAREAITALAEVRQQRAIKELQELGAKVVVFDRSLTIQQDRRVTIEIGPDWQGTVEDLQRLKWARDVQQLTFLGTQVTDAWMRNITYLDNLQRLVIKHARITDDAMRHVAELKRITHLDLMYTPITDAALDHLKNIRTLLQIRVYGTDMSEAGVERFRSVVTNVDIDFKMGAFLGVRCTQDPFPCEVIEVTPGSAAEQAGVQAKDIIVRYGGQPVTDFNGLRQLISRNKPGETVPVQVARGGALLTTAIERGHADQLGMEGESAMFGYRVTKVAPDGYAAKANIRAGDVIVQLDNERTRNPADFQQMYTAESEHKRAEVDLLRGLRIVNARVTLGEWTEE